MIDEENQTVSVIRTAAGPQSWKTGLKDTVIAYPGQVTRIKLPFCKGGHFVWHCHIVEHEDNETMRSYQRGPDQLGQPG